jgi:acyl-ACP thioesterase
MSINNKEIRRYRHRVESRDVDFMKKSTVMALGDYILHTAGEDADLNGFGVRTFNDAHNASWVLTRFAFEICRMPGQHEQLCITTWVSDISRVMTTRNFEVFDHSGKKIAAAVSNWAMIDITTRRPLDLLALGLSDSMVQRFDPPAAPPQRLPAPEKAHSWQHTVKYSDLDFNCHANSMKYLQWVVDTLPMETIESKSIRRVDINFIQESRCGQHLHIIAAHPDGSQLLYEIQNNDPKPICRIAIKLE